MIEEFVVRDVATAGTAVYQKRGDHLGLPLLVEQLLQTSIFNK